MGIVNKNYTFSSGATIIASEHNDNFDVLYSLVNGNIQNVNIASDAKIENSKLNLASITQDIAHSGTLTQTGTSTFTADTEHTAELKMTGDQLLFSKGADVASGTSITLGDDGNQFDITGNTTIQTIAIKQAGSIVWLKFDGALTLTDNTGNLELQGADISISAEDTVGLLSDGTNWHLISSTSAATDLKLPSQAQGDTLYFNGTIWTRLAAGTSGYFLKTQGAGANPTWAFPGLGLIDSQTITSASTSKQFTLTADKKYKVVYHFVNVSCSSRTLGIRMNNSSASQYTDDRGTTQTEIRISSNIFSSTSHWIKGVLEIDTYADGTIAAEGSINGRYNMLGGSTTNLGTSHGGLWLGGAVTAFHFLVMAASENIKGQIYLYEYALS